MSTKQLFPINQVANLFDQPSIKSLYKFEKKSKLLNKNKKVKFCAFKRMLLLGIAKFNGCTNGIEWLADFTGQGYTATNDHLLELEANGVIKAKRRNSYKGKGNNFYDIDMDNLRSYFMLDESVDNCEIENTVTPESVVSNPRIRGHQPQNLGMYIEQSNLLKKSLNKKLLDSKSLCKDSEQKKANEIKHDFAAMKNEAASKKKSDELKYLDSKRFNSTHNPLEFLSERFR